MCNLPLGIAGKLSVLVARAMRSVATSLVAFVLVYTVVFSIGIYYIRRLVLTGPKPAPVPEALPNRPLSLGAQE